jgi:hypothetical protein
MSDGPIETYLAKLRSELAKRGLVDARIIEEAQGHLFDATERGVQSGLSPEDAERDATVRFGSPETVANTFAAERFAVLNRVLFLAAVLIGIGIAYVDSRPSWDDTGVTAFALLTSAAVFGLARPQRPWLWALAIGIWIPLFALLRTHAAGSLAMFVVLAFPLAGAYAGMAVRRMLALV